MKKLPTLKRIIFPSLLGLVLASSFFSFSPFQFANKVLSQSSEEVVTPLASQDTQNEVKEQEDVTKKEEKRQVSDKESQQQPVGYSTETKDVSNSSNTERKFPSSQQTAKVTVDRSGTVTAKSTIVSSGKTIHLTMKYPKDGGPIAGTIEGDCEGSVTGNYHPAGEGLLKGTAKVKCPAGFIPIPVTIAYSSHFTPEDTEAIIDYTVTALGKTQKSSTTLLLIS